MRDSGSEEMNYNTKKYLPSAWPSRSSKLCAEIQHSKAKGNKLTTYTPSQWTQTHQQIHQNRQQTFSGISVKALPVFASLGFLYRCGKNVVFYFARLDWSGLSSNLGNARIASNPSQRHWSMRSYLEKLNFVGLLLEKISLNSSFPK